MKNSSLLLLAFLFISISAGAEDSPEASRAHSSPWSFGAGVITVQRPYKELHSRIYPIPLISYHGRQFQFYGVRGSYALIGNQKASAGVMSRYRFAGFDPDAGDSIRGMERRNDTLEVGLYTRNEFHHDFSLSTTLAFDSMGNHNGQEVSASIEKGFQFGKLNIGPTFEVKLMSNKLVDYYFGVHPNETTPIRPAYKAGSSVNLTPGISAKYPFTPKIIGMLFWTQEYLDTEIRNSPIVDKKSLTSIFAGLVFRI